MRERTFRTWGCGQALQMAAAAISSGVVFARRVAVQCAQLRLLQVSQHGRHVFGGYLRVGVEQVRPAGTRAQEFRPIPAEAHRRRRRSKCLSCAYRDGLARCLCRLCIMDGAPRPAGTPEYPQQWQRYPAVSRGIRRLVRLSRSSLHRTAGCAGISGRVCPPRTAGHSFFMDATVPLG